MKNEKGSRFCPFKRRIGNSSKMIDRKMIHEVSEHFDYCAGVKCMAYENGDCRRIRDKSEKLFGEEEKEAGR